MTCPRCHELETALQVGQSDYHDAVASTLYRITGKFAAYKRVELERAKIELEEHRMVCAMCHVVQMPPRVPWHTTVQLVRAHPVSFIAESQMHRVGKVGR